MFRTVEFILLLVLAWTVLRMLLPSKRKSNPPRGRSAGKGQERFDVRGKDISDGEYEELK